jgi:hypothetical protein
MKFRIAVITAATIFASAWTANASITGNPSADGWTSAGNSLENGTYVRGIANYGFDAYGTGFTVQSGSSLDISAGSLSWLAGDTVLGVGGVFHAISAAEAGWGAFTGGGVNALLSNPTGPKLQAKFGTSAATWAASTVAPGAGNGAGSGSLGGGTVQVRTSGYNTPTLWATGSGLLQSLADPSHIDWTGHARPDAAVARVIWNYDSSTAEVGSWELLLNTSLLDRLYPGWLLPSIGDMAIATAQNGDNDYTDALVNMSAVPEPTTMIAGALLLLPFGASTVRMLRKSRKA